MGAIGSYIFGSGPSTSTVSPAPVNQLDPTQQAVEGFTSADLVGSLQPQMAPVTTPFTSDLVGNDLLTASTSGLQNQSLQDFSNLENGSSYWANLLGNGQSAPLNQSLDSLENALSTAQNPNTAASYFQNAVYTPLEQTFTQQTLPDIVSALGGNQGGPQSTAASNAVSQAANNFTNTLASTQSQVGLQEQGQIPGIANALSGQAFLPMQAETAGLTNAGSALTAGGVPQAINQAALTNQQGYYQTEFGNTQSIINDLLGIVGQTTTTPQDVVVNPGSQGLLSSVISAFAGGAGKALSDKRMKKDVQRVGTTDNDLPLYLFHYNYEDDDAPLRLGLMAQDVEKDNPDAVGEWGGVKFVDYLAALAMEDA